MKRVYDYFIEDDRDDESLASESSKRSRISTTKEFDDIMNIVEFCQIVANVDIKEPKMYGKNSIINKLDRIEDEEKARLYQYGLIPPLLKSDMRRYYAHIFAYVHNSGNFELLKQFMFTFMVEDIQLIVKRPNNLGLEGENTLELQGYHQCCQFWFGRIYDVPDAIFTTSCTTIRLRADQIAVITTDFHVIGTRLVDPNMVQAIKSKPSEDSLVSLDESMVDKPTYFPERDNLPLTYEQISQSPEEDQIQHEIACDFFDDLEFANDVILLEEDNNPTTSSSSKRKTKLSPLQAEKVAFPQIAHISSSDLNEISIPKPFKRPVRNRIRPNRGHSSTNKSLEELCVTIAKNNSELDDQLVPTITNLKSPKPLLQLINFHGRMTMFLNPEMKIFSLEIEKV